MDYNEILCQAIDTIVAKRISEISYDQTIICTIIDDSDRENGRYKVQSNDQLKFDAYCENTTYKNDYQVNVLIPNGDFSLKKTILGRYTANNDTEPVAYVSPLEKVVPMTPNYAIGANTPVGLTANGTQQVYGDGPIFKYTNIGHLPYDTLCIKADFKCQLQNYLIRTGNYGLRVIITTDKEVVDVSLDSAKDMFGNPYGFISYFTQEQTYHVNLKGSIESIQGYFYQRSNFTYYDSQEEFDPMVPVLTDGDNEVPNIFINNIEVFFGYDISQIEDNTVKIYTADPDYYSSTSNLNKHFTLMWYNKTEENKYLGFTDGTFNKEMAKKEERDPEDTNVYYWVEWYRDNNDETWPVVGEWGTDLGLNDKITYTGTCHDLYSETSFKARVYCNGNYYESNTLTFTNQTLANADSTNALDVALNLHHGDYSEDAYPYYGADNMLINIADARRARALWFSYESTVGAILEPSVLDKAKVLWYMPTAATMLDKSVKNTYPLLTTAVLQEWIDEAIVNLGDIESTIKAELSTKLQEQFMGYLLPGFDCYYTILNAEDGKAPTQEEKTFYYQIKKAFNASNMNNIIKLKVIDKNCHEYSAEKSFVFATSGNCGTDYSLVISEVNGYPAYTSQADYALTAKLYDGDFQDITPSGGIGVNYSTPSSASDYEIATASTYVEWSGMQVELTAEYPIPWAASSDYYYQGPVSIVYDSSGVNPNYYNGELAIFNKNNEKLSGVSWKIHYTTSDPEIIQYLPSIHYNSYKGYYYLKAKNMYMHGLDDIKMTLIASQGGAAIWGQPLLVYQNQYASALLNKWGGEMVIDKEGNYILTAMIGAGIKNEDNTFSGVLMGDVGTKTGDKSMSKIGLYGIHEGAQSFGLKIDGTMFLGKSGLGQIIFDGNYGFIYSGSWKQSFEEGVNPFNVEYNDDYTIKNITLKEGTDGMAIDLQSGHLDAFNFKLTSHNVKFDSHELQEDEEHFYHMNIETNALDQEGEYQYFERPYGVGFTLDSTKKYYLKTGENSYELYTGTSYPPQIFLYEKMTGKEVYTEVPKGASLSGDTDYYIYTTSGYVVYEGTEYPTDHNLYVLTHEEEYYEKRLKDSFDSSKTYYLMENGSPVIYTGASYPESPVLYEQVQREHGYYHIRFKSDGSLELSIMNATILADQGITLGDFIYNVDEGFVYIADSLIGTPDDPKPGTVYDHIAGQIKYIEDEVIGIPEDVKIGTVLDYIAGQVKYIEDEVIGIPPTLEDASVYSYVNAQSYLTTEGVFNGLTDGGERQGIYPVKTTIRKRIPKTKEIIDANGETVLVYEYNLETGELLYELNEDGKSYKYEETTGIELYINASYIRTGILASSNWKGALYNATTNTWYKNLDTAQQDATNDVILGKASWTDEWTLHPIEGTYWNLNEGKMWASKFELNAWTNKTLQADGTVNTNAEAGGLYLNSHPGTEGYYLSIGHTTPIMEDDGVTVKMPPHWIQYKGDGSLAMQMNTFILDAFDEINKEGIYLNSHPGENLEPGQTGYYFIMGNANNFIQLDHEGNFTIQTNSDFTLNAWHPANDECEIPYAHGIYISADGVQKDAEGNIIANDGIYFRAGIADELSTLANTSNVIEVSKDRVLIASEHVVLDGWDSTEQEITVNYRDADGNIATRTVTGPVGGVYLNSKPDIYKVNEDTTLVDQYFSIGNGQYFMQFNKNGELSIQAKTFALNAWDITSNGGVVIDSAPGADGHTGYWLSVGSVGNFIQFDKDDKLVIQIGTAIEDGVERGKFILNAWHSTNEGIYMNSKPDTNDGIYFRAGYGNVEEDTSELIEVGQNRVLISSKHFVLDAYDHTIVDTVETGGIYLNSAPGVYDNTQLGTVEVDQYLHIGNGARYIQYSGQHELKICVNNLVIDAYDQANKRGIWLDSLATSGHYLIVGNASSFIELDSAGNMTFQTNSNFIVNAVSGEAGSQKGLYIDSNPTDHNSSIYLLVGDETGSYLKYTVEGLLELNGKITADEGKIGGWYIQSNRIYGAWTESGTTYYLNLWSYFPDGTYGSQTVAGLSSRHWRIQAGASETGYGGFTKGFGVTRDGEMAANSGIISGWTIDQGGIYYYHPTNGTLIAGLFTDMSKTDYTIIKVGNFNRSDWVLMSGDYFATCPTLGVVASKGYIGDWEITQGEIKSVTGGTRLTTTGDIELGSLEDGTPCVLRFKSDDGTGYLTFNPNGKYGMQITASPNTTIAAYNLSASETLYAPKITVEEIHTNTVADGGDDVETGIAVYGYVHFNDGLWTTSIKTTYINDKELGELAFADSVKKKLDVTMTGTYQYYRWDYTATTETITLYSESPIYTSKPSYAEDSAITWNEYTYEDRTITNTSYWQTVTVKGTGTTGEIEFTPDGTGEDSVTISGVTFSQNN